MSSLESKFNEMKEKRNFINQMLDMFCEDDNCPMDFKIMRKSNEISDLDREIMMSKSFTRLPNDHILKQKMSECYDLTIKCLNEIKSQLEDLDDDLC